jgi:hypothetical protein
MRPWQALAIALGSVALWWGVRAIVWWPDAVGVLSRPVMLIAMAPAVLALSLAHRRRLGRATSRGFVAQAVLWQVFGLALPRYANGKMSSLLTYPFVGRQNAGLLSAIPLPYNVLGLGWVLVMVWLVLVAWFVERAPDFQTPAPVGLTAGDDQ